LITWIIRKGLFLTDHYDRIAIYLPTLVEGGAERILLNLATGFSKRGYPVDFVLAQREGAFMPQFPSSIHLVELNPIHLKFGRSIFSLPAFIRYIRRERPVAMLTGLYANIIAIWAKRLSGVPLRLVISEHSTLSLQLPTLSAWYRQILSRLIRWNYPHADEIIAVSHGVADDLSVIARIPRDNITVIYNPIITPELVVKAKEKLEHPWFNPGQPPVILAVGRLSHEKDYPLLINTFARVRQSIPARLLILGDGPDRSELVTLVKQLGLEKDVSMPGFISNPYPYMIHASLLVLSSRWEGLPTVLVEALYCGIPIVATDCRNGPREILCNGKYGKLVPVGDQGCLAEAILGTLYGKRVEIPEKAWQPFEVDNVVDQYLKVLMGDRQ
jgi:glycosyltransferase involved in cell wall biosynthesis